MAERRIDVEIRPGDRKGCSHYVAESYIFLRERKRLVCEKNFNYV